MKLRICHLYPRLLNLYGDAGNVLILARRAQWRGIAVEVANLEPGQRLDPRDYDLFFLGGGPDREQELVSRALAENGRALAQTVEDGAALLAICGGYQLLGRYYRTEAGCELPGLGLFPAYTEGGTARLKGNVVLRAPVLAGCTPVIGYENHSGRTYLDSGCAPLGEVLHGHGNNGRDAAEGCVYLRALGTYLHGPLLSKNPHLADHILGLALERRYGKVELPLLDDAMELRANAEMLTRIGVGKRTRPPSVHWTR